MPKVSALPVVTTVAGTDTAPVVASGVTSEITIENLHSGLVPKVDTQVTTVEKRVVEVQAAGVGMANPGKFAISVLDNVYVGESDPTLYFGYNTTAGGALITAGEPGAAWGIEANYNDGSGDNKMEMYWQYTPVSPGLYRRPFFWQINRDTDRIVSAEIRGAETNGLVISNDDGTVAGATVARVQKFQLTVYGFSTADTVLRAEGGTGRNASIQLSRNNGTGSFIMSTDTNVIAYVSVTGQRVMSLYSTPIGAAGAAISVGVVDNSAVATFDVVASNAGVKGLVIRCKSTQTANAFEIQDSGSTPRIFATKATATVAPSLVVGSAALATTATDGFLYIPTCAGVPTGVPTTQTGTVALQFDTTNNKLYVYDGGWLATAALT
jgi:hypothetical protein